MQRLNFSTVVLMALTAVSLFGCRLKSKGATETVNRADDRQAYKLIATCSTDSADAQYRSIVIQEDESTRLALLMMDNGEKTADTLKTFGASVTAEDREGKAIRKVFQSEKFSLSLSLERNPSDTFDAKLSQPEGKPDVAYVCAM